MAGSPEVDRAEVSACFRSVQDAICAGLELLDGKAVFEQHEWEREGGGGGRTRVIADGALIEKGGVNFSAVWGRLPAAILRELDERERPPASNQQFYATGVSLVLHPLSPLVPIIHMNVRYIETADEIDGSGESSNAVAWFGGGIDLTPHYIDPVDAAYFHGELKKVCDRFDPGYYQRFKDWADVYFYLPHRAETRGIGGIFFDRLFVTPHEEPDAHSGAEVFSFVKAVADALVPVYSVIAGRHRDEPWTERETAWQLFRRGRYAEFNLAIDRGTKFGMFTGARAESVLMSLPPLAAWPVAFSPEPGSREQRTQELLRKGIDWAGMAGPGSEL